VLSRAACGAINGDELANSRERNIAGVIPLQTERVLAIARRTRRG